ncbi:MAG: beta-propeller domain-containing protein [Halobacteria archaeon]
MEGENVAGEAGCYGPGESRNIRSGSYSNDTSAEKRKESGERRASSTNVQVAGIDEPDILKTTPETIYRNSARVPRGLIPR